MEQRSRTGLQWRLYGYDITTILRGIGYKTLARAEKN